ncbi:hypothetical protein [Streptosporangium sp. V21-05]|uniref:hypothetical protein n=1 Tax=Streptosporangium sp. V21-05 TaxID=3446115 RepID=UPI003F53C164
MNRRFDMLEFPVGNPSISQESSRIETLDKGSRIYQGCGQYQIEEDSSYSNGDDRNADDEEIVEYDQGVRAAGDGGVRRHSFTTLVGQDVTAALVDGSTGSTLTSATHR